MGLEGMEDRVRALKGRFMVEDLPGRGVRISAVLPRQNALEDA
jgi:signal transduction histidine kinase